MARGETPERTRLIAELCAKYPRHGNHTIAKRLYADNPLLFSSYNAAQCAVRHHRGNRGGESRKFADKKGTRRISGIGTVLPPLPRSEARAMPTYRLPCTRALILGDVHIPFQDNNALQAALTYGKQYDPDLVLLNGDIFDFYQLSKFKKDPTVASLKSELVGGKRFFTRLRHTFPKARIVFRYGNHDRRWDDYIMGAAPLLWESLESLRDCWHPDAGIPQNNIEVIREKCLIKLGKLTVIHGDELPRGMASPVNAARGVFIKAYEPTYAGHFHQESKQPAKTITGKRIIVWTSGMLCGESPEYLPINQWTTGFGTVDVKPNGKYVVTQRSIIDGEIY